MIKEILYKWFGLDPLPCNTCEVLRSQLDESNRERRELLSRLLERDKPEPLSLSRGYEATSESICAVARPSADVRGRR